MDVGQELGVQSYCFRNFKENARAAELVKECGLTKIEICAVHVDFQAPGEFDRAISTYKDAGVGIVSTGVNRVCGEEAKDRNLFEFCKSAGAKFMSVDFPIDAAGHCLAAAEKLADEYDIRLGIHNHGSRHWLGCADALQWVFKQTGERIGLCLDTAWALHSREDPIALAEKFADRLYGVHVKDFVFDRAGRHEDVVVGTGNLDLAKLIETMKAGGFDGCVVLEYEGDVENPVPALRKCVQAVRAAC